MLETVLSHLNTECFDNTLNHLLLPESYCQQGEQAREGNRTAGALVAVHNHIKTSFQVLTKHRPRHETLNVIVILFGILSSILTSKWLFL